MRTYAFFYFIDEKNSAVFSETVAKQTAYWKGKNLPNYYGGPFADYSGGLIVFPAGSQEEAEKLVSADPFVKKELLKDSLIKEWTLAR